MSPTICSVLVLVAIKRILPTYVRPNLRYILLTDVVNISTYVLIRALGCWVGVFAVFTIARLFCQQVDWLHVTSFRKRLQAFGGMIRSGIHRTVD